jgi:hypothetical protein
MSQPDVSMDLNLTYLDIQDTIRAFSDGLGDMADWVNGLIEDQTMILMGTVRQQGLTPNEVSWVPPVYVVEGDPDSGVLDAGYSKHPILFKVLQQIVKLRVRAEVLMALSHELGELSSRDLERAQVLEDRIHQRPETMIEGWSGPQMRGSWGYGSGESEAGIVSSIDGTLIPRRRTTLFSTGGLRRHRM